MAGEDPVNFGGAGSNAMGFFSSLGRRFKSAGGAFKSAAGSVVKAVPAELLSTARGAGMQIGSQLINAARETLNRGGDAAIGALAAGGGPAGMMLAKAAKMGKNVAMRKLDEHVFDKAQSALAGKLGPKQQSAEETAAPAAASENLTQARSLLSMLRKRKAGSSEGSGVAAPNPSTSVEGAGPDVGSSRATGTAPEAPSKRSRIISSFKRLFGGRDPSDPTAAGSTPAAEGEDAAVADPTEQPIVNSIQRPRMMYARVVGNRLRPYSLAISSPRVNALSTSLAADYSTLTSPYVNALSTSLAADYSTLTRPYVQSVAPPNQRPRVNSIQVAVPAAVPALLRQYGPIPPLASNTSYSYAKRDPKFEAHCAQLLMAGMVSPVPVTRENVWMPSVQSDFTVSQAMRATEDAYKLTGSRSLQQGSAQLALAGATRSSAPVGWASGSRYYTY